MEIQNEFLAVDESFKIPIVNQTIAIWSGFEAMAAAIKDPDSVCNFNIDMFRLFFWLEY